MSSPQTEFKPQRLRAHPSQRFAGAQHVFDLQHEIEELRSERRNASSGHRQKTLFHHAPVTQVLFAFAGEAELREHRTHGPVTILCLEGVIQVEAEGQAHVLEAMDTIVLDPDVPHTVRSNVESAMLLTVHGQSQAAPSA